MIRITDRELIENGEAVKKIRDLAISLDCCYTITPNKKQIHIKPRNGESRKKVIEALRALNEELRFVAPVPKAEQHRTTKVILRKNTYDEPLDVQLNEMERCIGIRPLNIKKIKDHLQLVIFDPSHSFEDLARVMRNTSDHFFGSPKMKPEPYKKDPKRVVQCKNCYLFNHSTTACHGRRCPETITTLNQENMEIDVCYACHKPGHGANQVKCERFQAEIKKQTDQHTAREAKNVRPTIAAKRTITKQANIRHGISFANIATTRIDNEAEFPQLGRPRLANNQQQWHCEQQTIATNASIAGQPMDKKMVLIDTMRKLCNVLLELTNGGLW